ncbi:HD-GYP domain-containing protein [Spirochaeta lutea]|uniref:HD-GYP domain-containing protein n=1 Tax=Spirochaeta lutea TaxID=1480694 RepID=A0A098R4F1_9SPIO|nr:HD domain-containing phosphohydrolase [Spirochaeta lutea]KGE73642.1 hypothetical protein DC28_03140 [Spirochaeta lutea]
MKEHLITTLQPGKHFSQPAYLDEKYILLSPEVPITDDLISLLAEWDYDYVYCDGDQTDKDSINTANAGEGLAGNTLEHKLKDQALFEEAAQEFRSLADFTEKLFTSFVTRNELPVKDVSSRVRDAIEVIRENRSYIVRITEMDYPGKNYLVLHSVKSLIIGTTIGLSLKLPNHRLIELGSALLLHEIGMVKLPPKIYMSDKPLTPEERKAITAHTLLGFKVLKAEGYPMSVCLGVLESHENMDGSGYPRGLTGDKISLYAKIIGVVSSYAALSSERPFRQAVDGHSSILELLKNRGKRYDELVLRALIQNLSIYPLGTFVEINGGAKGMVVQTNPERPKAPVVKLLISGSNEVFAEMPLVDTAKEGAGIVRSLNVEEARVLKTKIS